MAYKSYNVKVGRLRLYSHTTGGGPFFLEVPFRGTITAPADRPRPAENLVLDRGRLTADAHYTVASDEALMAPLPFACNFRVANTEPNFSKLLTIIRSPANTGTGAPSKTLAPSKPWNSTKGTTQLRNAEVSGGGTALVTTPGFTDTEKWCCNVEVLWEDPDNTNDRGMRWAEVYFPPDRQITEGENDVMCDLSGEIYGLVSTITAFTAGVES